MTTDSIDTQLPIPFVSHSVADPFIFKYGGSCYLTGTADEDGQKHLYAYKADSLSALPSAKRALINGDDHLAWAPEVHCIGGRWFANWAKGDDWTSVCSTITALKPGMDPADSAAWDWDNSDTVTRAHNEPLQSNGITLDMTYFNANGQWFAMWSARNVYPKLTSANLYIGRIDPDDPSTITSDITLVSQPHYDWETRGAEVNEAPAAIIRDNTIFVTFSASAVGHDYCIGLLRASVTDDLLDPASWKKSETPLLTSADVPSQQGPGHNSFFTDSDGTTYVVFHAELGTDTNRQTIVRKLHWRADGLPDLTVQQ